MIYRFFLGLCIAIFISACGGGSSSSSDDSDSTPTASGQIDLSTTFDVDVNNLPIDGDLHVYAAVDGGTQQDMQIVNTTASTSISGLSVGTHTIDIEIVFIYNNGTSITLSSASSTLNVVDGANPLDISSISYVTSYDDDNDGVSNLDEMNAGASPTDPECVLDVSVIGSCTLG